MDRGSFKCDCSQKLKQCRDGPDSQFVFSHLECLDSEITPSFVAAGCQQLQAYIPSF